MTNFYANPYSNAAGFFFSSLEELEAKSKGWKGSFGEPVEEWSVDFIAGAPGDSELFAASGINQSNINRWFEEVQDLADDQRPALFFLLSNLGQSLDEALGNVDEPCIHQSNLKDAASEVFDESFLEQIPSEIRCYIDYDSYARDMELSGAMASFQFGGETWTCTNADGL